MFGFSSGFLNNRRLDGSGSDSDEAMPSSPARKPQENTAMRDRCRYIPVRLKYEERKYLRLVEAALGVNDYTTKVDNPQLVNTPKRTHRQVEGIFALLSCVVVGVNYDVGQEVVGSKDFKNHKDFLCAALELARRHKVMNPEKMRSEYGKLIYLLQDSNLPDVQALVDFDCVKPIKTVYTELEANGLLHVLDDPLIEVATAVIKDDKSKTKRELQKESKRKYAAIDKIARKYATREFDEEEVKQCLYSVSDNNSYLAESRDVIDQTITWLKTYFNPDTVEEGLSLAIEEGVEESRLTHSHQRQYHYILQSLTLWRDVAEEMFRLWWLAESDLLSHDQRYELKDTGQGFHRVQQSPKTFDAMKALLARIQQRLDEWVGSSVIHMGDHNVPNALVFIDKYAQVPRILGPINTTLVQLDRLDKDPPIRAYLNAAFGGKEGAKKLILRDFFRFGFDGSGADNFFDAGSCIDGRLTSAWNWCSKLDQKPYYPVFKLAGFSGFDGSEGFEDEGSKK